MPGPRYGLVFLGLLALLPMTGSAGGSALVERADLNGVINSVTATYIGSEVRQAVATHADALLIVIDTPGGESQAMDAITEKLLSSPVPVIAFVAPSGARAASAGLFVAQSADVLAMAPGTNIGSAHPINGNGTDIAGDLGRKVLNDAVARVRNLATLHGRNADWAESAVRQSVNIGADEAVRIHVADLVAKDVTELLSTVDGRTLARSSGPLPLHTAGATVADSPMSPVQEVLHLLIDPNVAFLLMLLAIYGLIMEVTSPGAILPGVVGSISAIVALISFASLPVTFAGALLVILAFVLFLVDVKAPTHGILTMGGLVALVLGSTLLIDTGPIGLGIDWRLIAGAAVISAVGFLFVVRKVVETRTRHLTSGADALMGSLGESRSPLDPKGQVFVAGAIWPGIASGRPIPAGATVRVIGRREGSLEVEAERKADRR